MNRNLKKIDAIEKEISNTRKNKSTEIHLRILKTKLSKIREQEEVKELKKKGKKTEYVNLFGNIICGLLGSRSVGKSSFFNNLIEENRSKTAEYFFTTLKLIPGSLEYEGLIVQIFDLRGVIDQKEKGRYGKREVYEILKRCTCVALVVDPNREHEILSFKEQMKEYDLVVGRERPKIYLRRSKKFSFKYLSREFLFRVEKENEIILNLKKLRIRTSSIVIEEKVSEQDIYDICENRLSYVKLIIVYTKKDLFRNFVPSHSRNIFINNFEKETKNIFLKKLKESHKFINIYLVAPKYRYKILKGLRLDEHILCVNKDLNVNELYTYIHTDFKNSTVFYFDNQSKRLLKNNNLKIVENRMYILS